MCPLCDRKVAGSILGQVKPNALKMVPAALSLGAQHLENIAITGVSIMMLGGISCHVFGVIFKSDSTIKVSIELPATSPDRHYMTERSLTVT